MQRGTSPLRRSDSILLYGFGLALASSLVFNGFLLYEQTRQRSIYEYELGNSVHLTELVALQQQLSECRQVNQQKDNHIGGLTDTSLSTDTQRYTGSVSHRTANLTKIESFRPGKDMAKPNK